MEYFNNVLCISSPEITDGDSTAADPKARPLMTKVAYDQYIYRNPQVKVRRACKNHPALLSFDLLRSDIKAKIEYKYGDPYKITTHNRFSDSITPDPTALTFFKEYRFDNGKALPEQTIIEYYNNAIILNAIHETINDCRTLRKALGGSNKNLWAKISEIINRLDPKAYPHSLPTNHRRLSEKYRDYLKLSYTTLIHSAFCNKNTEKINENGRLWVLARWANQVDRCACEQQLLAEYNEKAAGEGWKEVKNVGTIHNFLYREDVKPLWWGYRYGELKSKEKFSMQISTEMPSMRDSLWYSDGTKLNYYYLTPEGKVDTVQVYEVMDAFSEVMLGYHISKSEDYEAQYHGFKMALKTSGHKPFQITYDNQGGHKKLEAGEFLIKLAHLAIKTMPYNGKSKSIESAFGRFQSQFLKKDWYFTGRNITTKKDESKANLEFILANKSSLPTLDEIKLRYKERRDEWNHAAHPLTGKARIEMYYASINPMTPKLELWDMVDLFWITRKDPISCRAYGISFEEKKQKYDYLVYSAPGVPDQEWLHNNIDKKFIVKFDPDDMGLIYLYEKDASGIRFVKEAETKIVVHRGKQEQVDGDAAFIRMVLDENKRIRLEQKERMEEILKSQEQDAETYGLVTPILKGIEKVKTRKHKKETSYALVEKDVSNAVRLPDSDDDSIDYYKLY